MVLIKENISDDEGFDPLSGNVEISDLIFDLKCTGLAQKFIHQDLKGVFDFRGEFGGDGDQKIRQIVR